MYTYSCIHIYLDIFVYVYVCIIYYIYIQMYMMNVWLSMWIGQYVSNNMRICHRYRWDLMLFGCTGVVVGIQPTRYERKDTWVPEGSPLLCCWSVKQSSNPDVCLFNHFRRRLCGSYIIYMGFPWFSQFFSGDFPPFRLHTLQDAGVPTEVEGSFPYCPVAA